MPPDDNEREHMLHSSAQKSYCSMMESTSSLVDAGLEDHTKNTLKKEENLMNQDHKHQPSSCLRVPEKKEMRVSSSCPAPALGAVTNLFCYMMTLVGIILFGISIALGNYDLHIYPLIAVSTLCCLLYTNPSFTDKQYSRLITTLISRVHGSICKPTRYNFLSNESSSTTTTSSNKKDVKSRSRFGIWCRRRRIRGDPNMTMVNILFILCPCLYFIIYSIIDKLLSENFDSSSSSSHGHMANAFGKMSAFAMSAFLIPVSKHSILLKSLDLDPRYGLRVHIFSGYLAVITGLIHGLYFILIWIFLDKDGFWGVFPTRECWDWEELMHGRMLHGDGNDDDDNCHRRFVNLLGVLCGFFFLGLCLTSLWWVRRNHYRVFYYCHIIFSVLLLYGLAMHYNKMILYLAPSILYYFASSVPTWVQALKSKIQGGTRLMQVTHIPDSRGCVELTFPMEEFELDNANEALCGKYIRLSAPEISRVWHPFTVYTYSDGSNSLSLTFRVTGPFTKQLADRLHESKASNVQYPKIILDGYHGAEDQVSKAFRHDTILIVAGGVGIVSYIALINILRSTTVDEMNIENNEISNIRTKEIILHWICRDEGLIQYYANKFLSLGYEKIGNIPFRIFIHHTDPTYANTPRSYNENEDLNCDILNNVQLTENNLTEQGKTFVPFIFAGGNKTWTQNIAPAFVFSLICWGGWWLARYFYGNIQLKHAVLPRSLTITAVASYAIISSILCLVIFDSLPRVLCSSNEGKDRTFARSSDSFATGVSHSAMIKSCSSANHGLCPEAQIGQDTMQHSSGRPNFLELTEDIFNSSSNTGVFVCGPSSLLKTIRECCEDSSCALYEEIFEM